MNPQKKKSKADKAKKRDPDEEAIEYLKKDIEAEQKDRQNVEFNNDELERSVAAMERTVMELESGNYEADDSEVKHRYDNQRQLNMQLQEQKRWLEHELEQIKLKIQNEKLNPYPDTFSLDWDNLSENELKRLVAQLEKTRNDIQSDLLEMEYRLDHEGKEFHHFNYFCQLYRAEIVSLNRTLDALLRNGLLPPTYIITQPGFILSSGLSSFASSGAQTPGFIPQLLSPKKSNLGGSPTRKPIVGSPTRKANPTSPTRAPKNMSGSPKRRVPKTEPETSKARNVDPKLGPPRKTAGVRNLPKIDRKNGFNAGSGDELKNSVPLPPTGMKKSTSSVLKELDTVDESPTESLDES